MGVIVAGLGTAPPAWRDSWQEHPIGSHGAGDAQAASGEVRSPSTPAGMEDGAAGSIPVANAVLGSVLLAIGLAVVAVLRQRGLLAGDPRTRARVRTDRGPKVLAIDNSSEGAARDLHLVLLFGGLLCLLLPSILALPAGFLVKGMRADSPTARLVVTLLAYAPAIGAAWLWLTLGNGGHGEARTDRGAGSGPGSSTAQAVPSGLARDALHGVLAFVAALPTFAGLLLLSPLLARAFGGGVPDQMAHQTLRDLAENPSAWMVASIVVGSCVLVPMFEELVFRALLQGGLARLAQSHAIAIGVVSLFFGMAHVGALGVGGLHTLPVLVAVGVACGIAYARTGRVLVPIVLHALFNLCNVLLALAVIGTGRT